MRFGTFVFVLALKTLVNAQKNLFVDGKLVYTVSCSILNEPGHKACSLKAGNLAGNSSAWTDGSTYLAARSLVDFHL